MKVTLPDYEKCAEYHVAFKYYGYENIVQKINRICGNRTAFCAAPFAAPYPQTFPDVIKYISDYSVQSKNPIPISAFMQGLQAMKWKYR